MSTAEPRSASGIAFIAAGAAVLLSIVAFAAQLEIDTRFIYVLGFLAMSAAFVLLGRNDLKNGTARTASYFAALGWFLLALLGGVTGLPGIVASSAYFVLVGSCVVIGAVVVSKNELPTLARRGLIALLAATLVYSACSFLISYFGGPLSALLTIVIGAAALVTGYFLQTRR